METFHLCEREMLKSQENVPHVPSICFLNQGLPLPVKGRGGAVFAVCPDTGNSLPQGFSSQVCACVNVCGCAFVRGSVCTHVREYDGVCV